MVAVMSKGAVASGLNRRLIASFGGYLGTAVISIAFVPVYVRYLGIEAYGLIGFFLSLVPIFTLLDLGMGATLNRGLARLSVDAANAGEMRNLTRTLEAVYWAIPLIVVIFMLLMAAPIAAHWLKLQAITQDEATQALQLMGFAFAARLPTVLYFGALVGLDRIVLMNGLRLGLEATKAVGAVLVLSLVDPSLEAFFLWQIVASLIFSLVLAVATWRSMPAGGAPKVELRQIRGIARYALGVSGVAITAALLGQVDKLVLSRVLTLEGFGYYTLAWAVAGGMKQLVMPLTTVFLPRMSRALAVKDEEQVRLLYRKAGRVMSVLVVPAGLVLAAFADQTLLLWTGDLRIVSESGSTLAFLALGAVFSSLANMPYLLQLVYAWTRPMLSMNIAASIAIVPVAYVLGHKWGSAGAAAGWAAASLCYLIAVVGLTHRKVLPDELRPWYLRTLLVPLLPAVIVILCCRAVMPADLSSLATLAYILCAYGAAVVAAAGFAWMENRGVK